MNRNEKALDPENDEIAQSDVAVKRMFGSSEKWKVI
jgi:hypothetical protein